MSHEKYQHCIDECLDCATICAHCATSCLREEDVKKLIHCIQLDLECAAICRAAAEMMSLGSEYADRLCELCAEVCTACAIECEKHNHMEHCRECAIKCRRCSEACIEMMSV